MINSFLDIENNQYFGLWKKCQGLRNYPKIVDDINLFQITFFSALRSYLEETQKESLFTIDSRTSGFSSDLRDSIRMMHFWLAQGLLSKQTSSHFLVSSNPLFSGVKISGNILVYPNGFEECYQRRHGEKWIHDSYITPVLSKVGELLGAKVVIEGSSRELARTLLITSSYLGTTTETMQKVTFVWNRATTSRPLITTSETLQEGSMEGFLAKLREKGRYCDATLKSKGSQLDVHRFVLEYKECAALEGVDDLGVTQETLAVFLDFLYMTESDFVDKMRYHEKYSHIKPLTIMAHKYTIPSLMRCCVALLNLFASTWDVEDFKASFSTIDHPDVQKIINSLK